MTNRSEGFGDQLIEALHEAVAHHRGELREVRVDQVELTVHDAEPTPEPDEPGEG